MSKPDYAALDAKVLAEIEKNRALNELTAKALAKCAETCAHRWEHVPACVATFQAIMAVKRARVA